MQTPSETVPAIEDLVVEVPLRPLLGYISRQTGQSLGTDHFHALLNASPYDPVDWHRVLRSGLRSILHVNLGIPGLETPGHPIEENPEALYAAIVLGWHSLPVLFSGELEQALHHGLLDQKAMSNLRNLIRVSG